MSTAWREPGADLRGDILAAQRMMEKAEGVPVVFPRCSKCRHDWHGRPCTAWSYVHTAYGVRRGEECGCSG